MYALKRLELHQKKKKKKLLEMLALIINPANITG